MEYNGFKAVDDLSLSIEKNELICLVGHNGAGKTTLLNMIAGILKPTSGHATIFGEKLVEDIDKVR